MTNIKQAKLPCKDTPKPKAHGYAIAVTTSKNSSVCFLVPCKELGSHHFILTTNKKLNKLKKSITLLGSVRQGKTD